MGALWSKKENQFEKVLEKLEKDITHTEYRQRTAHTNKRRFVANVIYLAVLLELVVVFWYYFHKKPVQVLDRIIDSYPLVLPPFIAYAVSRLISFYYTRRIKSDDVKLVKLRAELKRKLDERKQATGFDTTQQLLSKYERLTKDEETPQAPKGAAVPQPPAPGNKGQQQPQQTPQPQQQQPQQQIRQRPPQQPDTSVPPPSISSSVPATRPPAPPTAVHPLPPPRPPMPTHRSWLDKLVDYVVGGEPQNSFALICTNCKAHNGLLPQSEMQSFQFRCRFCNHFNEAIATPSPSSSVPSSTSTPASAPASSSSGTQKQPSPTSKKK